jgi:hypothetical protein
MNMDDLLLKELGDLARRQEETERARLDERWDRLAAGTLTAEEEAELKAFAESSPEARETYQAFRPLGADFQARVVSKINAERKKRFRVLPFPPLIRRIEVWVGAAAAGAAGVFFLVRGPLIDQGYQASLEGAFKENRGAEAAPSKDEKVFTPGSPFILKVNPKQSLEHPGAVKARAFLSHSAGLENLRLLGLENKFEAVETGSVLLDARLGTDLQIPPGDWILWTVVARRSLPEPREVQARLRSKWPQHDSWHAVCAALTKEESPSPAQWQVACTPDFRVEGQTPE